MPDVDNHFHVVIVPGEWQVDASSVQTLLDSATLSGVRLPSSCRNGTCRTCMCRLISGQIHYKIEWPGLSADEKKEGYILPCVAYPESDLIIETTGAAAL